MALEQVERSRARRPFFAAILVTLLFGLCTSLWFYRRASRERETTAQINEFLTDGLLRQSNPNVGRGVDESLNQAIEDVAPEIDGRFPGKPAVAAGVHYTIAQDLDNAAQYDSAAQQYDAAAADWIKANGPSSQDAIFAQLQQCFSRCTQSESRLT